MSIRTFYSDGCTISVLGVIKGLESEAAKVQKAFDELKPDVVTISLSKEEIEGLRSMPKDFEPELSRYEEIYAQGLSRFGSVAIPPPCYVAALALAEGAGVPIIPVDLDEQTYSDLYCRAVSGSNLFRHSTRTWLMKRRRFSDKGPEEFVKAWDRAVNNLEGFRKVEEMRSKAMAEGILTSCASSKRLLAVIELERADDVSKLIDDRISAKKDRIEE